MSSTYFELMHVKHTVPYHNYIYNRLPEDEPSGSKHVEDDKKLTIKLLIKEMYMSSFYTV